MLINGYLRTGRTGGLDDTEKKGSGSSKLEMFQSPACPSGVQKKQE